MRDRRLRPHCPMSEQATSNPYGISTEIEESEQVIQNVVIVSGVKSDVLGAARLDKGAYHVERLITIKRCYLDCHYVVNLEKAAPELEGQRSSSDRGLQVETDNRNQLCNGASVLH